MDLVEIIGNANLERIKEESQKSKVLIAIYLLSLEEYDVLQKIIDSIEYEISETSYNYNLVEILGHKNFIEIIRNANKSQKIFIHFLVPYDLVIQVGTYFQAIENTISKTN